MRVHTPEHIASVAATAGRTVRFDPDTEAGPRSYEAALLAAGAVVDAVDRVLDGDLERAFCAVRPPGHHAEADRAMGFCLFNNVAVGRGARPRPRAASASWSSTSTSTTATARRRSSTPIRACSTSRRHAFPFYPGTGSAGRGGEGPGRGFTVNLPLPAGCGDAEYAPLYRDDRGADRPRLRSAARARLGGLRRPRDDPLGRHACHAAGFASSWRGCCATARGAAAGRAVVVLEGGYDLDGIAESSAAVVRSCSASSDEARARLRAADELLALYRERYAPLLAGPGPLSASQASC